VTLFIFLKEKYIIQVAFGETLIVALENAQVLEKSHATSYM